MNIYYEVGEIIGFHGIKGEFKLYPYVDYPDFFRNIKTIRNKDSNKIYTIDSIRHHKNIILMKVKEINTINEVEKVKTSILEINSIDLPILPNNRHYLFQLIGLPVYDTNKKYLGELKDIIKKTINDIYEIETSDNKIFYVPVVDNFIKKIDIENKEIIIDIIEGMIDEN